MVYRFARPCRRPCPAAGTRASRGRRHQAAPGGGGLPVTVSGRPGPHVPGASRIREGILTQNNQISSLAVTT